MRLFFKIVYFLYSLWSWFYQESKSWEERYKKNEIYTIIDFIERDAKNISIADIVMFVIISFLVKIVIRIQLLACIYFKFRKKKNVVFTNRILNKYFERLPMAFIQIFEDLSSKRKMEIDQMKSASINLGFIYITSVSRVNIYASITILKNFKRIKDDPEGISWKIIKWNIINTLEEEFEEMLKTQANNVRQH